MNKPILDITIINDNVVVSEWIKETILGARPNWNVVIINPGEFDIENVANAKHEKLCCLGTDIIIMDYDLGIKSLNGADLIGILIRTSAMMRQAPIFIAWSSDDENSNILCSAGCVKKPYGYNGQEWCTYFEKLVKEQQKLTVLEEE